MPVTAESAREMIEDPGIAIFDVRTLPEFRRGHMKGAIPIPVAEIERFHGGEGFLTHPE